MCDIRIVLYIKVEFHNEYWSMDGKNRITGLFNYAKNCITQFQRLNIRVDDISFLYNSINLELFV